MTTDATPLDRLLDAALPHVAFDGWSDKCFDAACADAGLEPQTALALCPRKSVDLAAAYHRRGDAAMLAALGTTDLQALRFRDRVAEAVWLRISAIDNREAVRRGTALFTLPLHAAEGARLIWGTADRIWTALGDTSRDYNWYTKRMTLGAVYGSTVLYWLGDHSEGAEATRAFIDRRIGDVMAFEETKAKLRKSPVLGPVTTAFERLLSGIHAPAASPNDVPGRWDGRDD